MEPVSTSADMETFGQGAPLGQETMGNQLYLMELVSSVQSLLSVKRPVRKGPAKSGRPSVIRFLSFEQQGGSLTVKN